MTAIYKMVILMKKTRMASAVFIIAIIPILLFQSVSALQPPPPWGWDAQQSGDFYFRPLPSGSVEVWYAGSEPVVVIPSEIEGYAVTQIGVGVIPHNPNWGGRFGGTNIFVIPDSITSIDDTWFDYEHARFRRAHDNAVDHIIYGYSGSFAEVFANEADMLFIPLDDELPITMFMSGSWLAFDEPPFIEDDIIFVPMRLFFENMRNIHPSIEARHIIWDGETQSITIELYDWFDLPPALFETVKITIGSDTFSIDGNTLRGSLSHHRTETNTFELEAPPRMVNGRVFIPLSFYLDYFGFGIDYDGHFRIFDIVKHPDADNNIPYARWINEIRS